MCDSEAHIDGSESLNEILVHRCDLVLSVPSRCCRDRVLPESALLRKIPDRRPVLMAVPDCTAGLGAIPWTKIGVGHSLDCDGEDAGTRPLTLDLRFS